MHIMEHKLPVCTRVAKQQPNNWYHFTCKEVKGLAFKLASNWKQRLT